jgi:pimeloyl-ACP methyl ester carboxylesterase
MASPWQRVAIAGRAADVFEPRPPRAGAVIWLRDLTGELPSGLAGALEAHQLRCIAPEARGVWWLDRVEPAFDPAISPERFILEHVLSFLDARAVALAGIGRGGQGAVRMALRHPARFPVAASLDGAFDFHEHHGKGTSLDELYPGREHARQDTAILHVDAHDWPPHLFFACSPESEWYRGNDRLHEKLSAMGVPHTAKLDSPADLHVLLAFVAQALERESRRLA